MAKNKTDEINIFLSDKSYDDLLLVKKLLGEEINNRLNKDIVIGASVTVADKSGKSTTEATIYGITEDYLLLKEGDAVLKKQYTMEDLLSINGKEI